MATVELWSMVQEGPDGTVCASLQRQEGGTVTLHLFDADAVELHVVLSSGQLQELHAVLGETP